MTRTAYIFIGVAVFTVIVWMLFAFNSKTPSLRALTTAEIGWTERIKEIGGKEAYGEFGNEVSTMSPALQHEHAHEFGAALYEAEGVDGLPVCDSRFSFGCFHEFLGRAISELGIASAAQLNEGCWQTLTDSPLSCQHGVGHGVLTYFGYSDADLRNALDVCEQLPHTDPIGGCYGGVFMEYNVRTMLGTEGSIRERTSDMHAPCSQLREPYQHACYFWQPQWWHQVLVQDGIELEAVKYSRIGEWCSEAPESSRRPCFEGIGNNLPPDADFDGAKAKALCEVATAGDGEHDLYCRSLAANSLFVGGAGKKGDALTVCSGLVGERYAYCAGYARNELNITNPEL